MCVKWECAPSGELRYALVVPSPSATRASSINLTIPLSSFINQGQAAIDHTTIHHACHTSTAHAGDQDPAIRPPRPKERRVCHWLPFHCTWLSSCSDLTELHRTPMSSSSTDECSLTVTWEAGAISDHRHREASPITPFRPTDKRRLQAQHMQPSSTPFEELGIRSCSGCHHF